MKPTLVLSLCAVATSLSVYAQGTFQALNLDNRVVDPNGAPAGAGFTGQWWAGADAGSLSPVGPPTAVFLGLVSAGILAVPGLSAGVDAAVQLRAWPDKFPWLAGSTTVGIVTLAGGIDIPARPHLGVGDLAPLLPEPSTIALAVLGGAALFFSHRRM